MCQTVCPAVDSTINPISAYLKPIRQKPSYQWSGFLLLMTQEGFNVIGVPFLEKPRQDDQAGIDVFSIQVLVCLTHGTSTGTMYLQMSLAFHVRGNEPQPGFFDEWSIKVSKDTQMLLYTNASHLLSLSVSYISRFPI